MKNKKTITTGILVILAICCFAGGGSCMDAKGYEGIAFLLNGGGVILVIIALAINNMIH